VTEHIYSHRNGETTPPDCKEWEWYWFDGIAHYENWTAKGNLVTVTGTGTHRVIGLVVVAMMLDSKHPLKDEKGRYVHNRPTMIAQIESNGYDLDKCEGRWHGPVHMPQLSDDIIPSTAAIEDYEVWKRFHSDTKPWLHTDN
jgi:hypothetical protein